MQESDLTREQARKMHDALEPGLRYLSKLKRRMEEERFPANDPLRLDVERAQAAMQGLCMTLHYMTCDGVAQKPRKAR